MNTRRAGHTHRGAWRLGARSFAAAALLALGAGGCGHLPFLARSTPAPAPPAARIPARAGVTAKPAAATPAPPARASRAATPRDRIAEARRNAAAAPAEPYWPYRAAELYRSLGEPDSALDAVRGALARAGGYAPALALFSKLEYDTGRHDDAIAVLESARMAAQRGGGDLAPELLAGLALHYAAAGRGAEAGEALRAAPGSSRAVDAAAAAIALGRSRDAEAVKLAEAALDHHPQSAACQNNAGIARLTAGDVAGARKALLKAIELDPSRPGPYYNLTILEKYYALDDAAAARWFAKYHTLSNDDPDGIGATLDATESRNLAEGNKP